MFLLTLYLCVLLAVLCLWASRYCTSVPSRALVFLSLRRICPLKFCSCVFILNWDFVPLCHMCGLCVCVSQRAEPQGGLAEPVAGLSEVLSTDNARSLRLQLCWQLNYMAKHTVAGTYLCYWQTYTDNLLVWLWHVATERRGNVKSSGWKLLVFWLNPKIYLCVYHASKKWGMCLQSVLKDWNLPSYMWSK